MAGVNPNYPNPSVATNTLPFTGLETVVLDTNASPDNGASPATVNATTAQLFGFAPPVALTDAATITTDASLGSSFSVTMGGSRTFANPTNLQVGRTYRWEISQDGTGSRVATWGTLFTFSGSSVLTTTASALDILTAYYDGTKLRGILSKAYA
jgi:hypothetical protein